MVKNHVCKPPPASVAVELHISCRGRTNRRPSRGRRTNERRGRTGPAARRGRRAGGRRRAGAAPGSGGRGQGIHSFRHILPGSGYRVGYCVFLRRAGLIFRPQARCRAELCLDLITRIIDRAAATVAPAQCIIQVRGRSTNDN
jgi:hypothetical protein